MSDWQKDQQINNAQGDENLEIMRFAPRYVQYVGKLVKQWLPDTGGLIELGSGDGQQTTKIVPPPASRLVCVEQSSVRRMHLSRLGYQSVGELDELVGSNASCLFTLNCLEHIEFDSEVLVTASQCLSANSRIIIYVPALPVLYSNMDRHVGHFRRYTKKALRNLTIGAGFEIKTIRYVDSLGVIPSLIYRLLPNAKGEPSPKTVAFYDKFLFPISRTMDKILFPFFGKNLIVVADRL